MGVLFYSRVENDIREVVDSINMMSLVHADGTGGDNMAVGECCSFISSIDNNILVDSDDENNQIPIMLNSFTISSGYTTWTIAHKNWTTLYKF